MLKHGLTIFIVALCIRAAYILFFVGPGDLQSEDQFLYISMARSILDTGPGAMTPERVPGYPIFLSQVFALFGDSQMALLAVQALLDSLTCVVVGSLAQTMLNRGYLVAGLLSAFNLNMVILSAMALTDSLFLFLFTLSLLFLFRYMQKGRLAHYLLCMLLLGAATNVRLATYYLIPTLIVCLAIWSWYRRAILRHILAQLLAGSLAVLLLLGPQHVINHQRYDSWSFVSQGGTHLLGWVVPATYQYSGRGSYQDGQLVARSVLQSALERDGLSGLPSNPFHASAYQTRVATSVLKDLGWMAVAKAWCVGAAINFIVPSSAFAPAVRAMPHPSFYEMPGNGAAEKLWNYARRTDGVVYLAVLGAGTITSAAFFLAFVVGAWRFGWAIAASGTVPSKVGAGVFSLVVIGYFLAVTGPIIGSKYRLPMEPVMTVYAVLAIWREGRRCP